MSVDAWLKDAAYRGLLGDIVANPDDDTPRLVMADWLEERGHDERARFIRVQIERSKLSEHSRRWWDLRIEEARLLAAHEDAWLGKLRKMLTRVEWRRGFVERVTLGVGQLAKHAGDVFTLTPVYHLQIMRLAQAKLSMTDLAAIEALRRTRSLCLRSSNLGDERLAAFLNAVPLPHLEELDLTGAGVGPRTLLAIEGRCPPSLRSLSLGGNYLPGHFPAIASRLGGFTLHELDLGGTDLRRPDMDALADWPGLASVRRLDLSGMQLGVAGCERLFGSPHLGPLERLHLGGVPVRIGGMRAIVGCPRLAGLKDLRLNNSAIDQGGIEALAESPGLASLESLDLGNNEIGRTRARVLAGWPGLSRLRSLSLNNNLIGDAGLAALLESPHLGDLASLGLARADLTAGAAKHLIGCPKLASLCRLDISGNTRIREGELRAMLASPTLSGLRSLGLFYLNLPSRYAAELAGRFPV